MSDIKLGRIYKRKKEYNSSSSDIYIIPVEIHLKGSSNDLNYYKIQIVDKDTVQNLYRESYIRQFYDLLVSDE